MNWLKKIGNKVIRSRPKWWIIPGIVLSLLGVVVLFSIASVLDKGEGVIATAVFFAITFPLILLGFVFFLIGTVKGLRLLQVEKRRGKWKRAGLLSLIAIFAVLILWGLRWYVPLPFVTESLLFQFLLPLMIIGVFVWPMGKKWRITGAFILIIILSALTLSRFGLISGGVEGLVYFDFLPPIVIGAVIVTAMDKWKSWKSLISIMALVTIIWIIVSITLIFLIF